MTNKYIIVNKSSQSDSEAIYFAGMAIKYRKNNMMPFISYQSNVKLVANFFFLKAYTKIVVKEMDAINHD